VPVATSLSGVLRTVAKHGFDESHFLLERELMKTLATATILMTCLTLAVPAGAQTKSRAEVKAETASAVKAGEIPRGEGSEPKAEPRRKVSAEEKAAARSKRKAETAAALKAGEIPKGDVEPEKRVVQKPVSPEERAASRAKRKAETAAAVKSGEIPRGEAGTSK
jgi:hypothetical protein